MLNRRDLLQASSFGFGMLALKRIDGRRGYEK